MNQKGGSVIFIVLAVALVLAIAGSAFYLGNQTAKRGASPTPTPLPSLPPTPASTPTPQSSATLAPSNLMQVTRVFQAACNSSSCSSSTTLVIDGLNLNLVTKVSAQGQNDNRFYQGVLGNIVSNGQEIIVDFLNLPCQTYQGTIFYSLPHDQPVTFNFTPSTCK